MAELKTAYVMIDGPSGKISVFGSFDKISEVTERKGYEMESVDIDQWLLNKGTEYAGLIYARPIIE